MPIFILLFFILLILYAVVIERYRKGWNQLPEYIPDGDSPSVFISVIISARNEENNINDLLNSLEEQVYSKELFEVIVIDDHSTDNTWAELQQYIPAELQTVFIQLNLDPESSKGIIAYKKKAIETGINHARGRLIVTSDADCLFNPNWLLTIASFYELTKAKCIAAPVVMSRSKSFLSLFQSLDFMTLQGITGAAIHKKIHTMCNGANFIYEREIFHEVGGFRGIDNIPSGDDMLLMEKIYEKFPDDVRYLKSSNAIVTTGPMKDWRSFINQRIRWSGKTDHYSNKKMFHILLLVYILNVCFLILTIAIFFKSSWLFLLLLFLLAKTIIEFPFVNTVAKFFGRQFQMKFFPLMQPIHILYTIIAGWFGKFGSYEWKERRVQVKKTSND